MLPLSEMHFFDSADQWMASLIRDCLGDADDLSRCVLYSELLVHSPVKSMRTKKLLPHDSRYDRRKGNSGVLYLTQGFPFTPRQRHFFFPFDSRVKPTWPIVLAILGYVMSSFHRMILNPPFSLPSSLCTHC